MEEGRDRPSEEDPPESLSFVTAAATCRNGGGPRSALGGLNPGNQVPSDLANAWPQWRRAEIGPRSGMKVRSGCLQYTSCRNGGGPRSALGGTGAPVWAYVRPRQRRNGGGPRSALGVGWSESLTYATRSHGGGLEIGPRSQGIPILGFSAAMEEGRDRPSEAPGPEFLPIRCSPPPKPQWRRAEIGPRRRSTLPTPVRWPDLSHAAMEEGRDRPSEPERAPNLPWNIRAICSVPQWRRAEIGPRSDACDA